MFGELISEKAIDNMRIELFQRAEGDPINYKLIDGKFFLMITVNDILISQPEIGTDEARVFTEACESGVVNVGERNTN